MRKKPLPFVAFYCTVMLVFPTATSSSTSIPSENLDIKSTSLIFCPPPPTDWVPLASGTDETLNDIYFTDANVGWVVGANGVMLKTVDGGYNWTSLVSGSTASLNGVSFLDANIGYAVGFPDRDGTENVLETIDGGANWTKFSPSGFTSYYDVDILEYRNGAAVGTNDFPANGVVLQILSSGNFNYQRPVPIGINTELRSIDFVYSSTSSAHGWAVGTGGVIIKTTTGGATWTTLNTPTSNLLFGVSFVDTAHGWVVGINGTILHTSDGGTTWESQSSNTNLPLYSIEFIDTEQGWAVGASGLILYTTDGGEHWYSQESGTAETLNSVHFMDNDNGWIVGAEGTILKYMGDILPIELLDFKGTCSSEYVQLSWYTLAETQNSGFHVERSTDGAHWKRLGFVASLGNSNNRQDYSYLDHSARAETNYYRLLQVDGDGSSTYSPVVSVLKAPTNRTLTVYPNPVRNGSLRVILPQNTGEQAFQLQVYNIVGQLVDSHQIDVEAIPDPNIDINQYPPGIYTVHLSANEQFWSSRIVVK